jgi:uncharacterized membrane protein (GlpM family)
MLTIFFLKLLIAIAMVVLLTIIAEHVSPAVAGIISGLPTGSAITLFFFGLEYGAVFAADSAVFNMAGMIASMSLIATYFFVSSKIKKHNILFSSLLSILTFIVVTAILHTLKFNKIFAFILPVCFSFLMIYLFKIIENHKVENKVKLTFKIILLRAFLATILILAITYIPKVLSVSWSGLFSAFPTTLFPLIVIMHYTYDKKYAHTIIKNMPKGIIALIVYSLCVSLFYPIYGVYWGTFFCFLIVIVITMMLFYGFKKLNVL